MEAWKKLSVDLSKRDLKLAPLIKEIGPPSLKLERNQFRVLVESIVSQQLSTKVAATIAGRVAALSSPFPSASFLKQVRTTSLRKAGLSQQKASYIKDLAAHWEKVGWRKGWAKLPDEALIERLTEVNGIGVWTAQMFLIFSLGRPNVLPALDFGIRRGVMRLYRLNEIPKPKEIAPIVAHWEGCFSIGSWYLWQAQDRKLLGEVPGELVS